MKNIMSFLRKTFYVFFGTWEARNIDSINQGYFKENSSLENIFSFSTGSNEQIDDESPIFIFSSGWRAGSTYLQRLVMSSGKVLIWGEPFDKSDLIQSLSTSMIPFSQSWPPNDFYIDNNIDGLSNKWIANLYPSAYQLKQAHRNFIKNLFQFRLDDKCIRWGIKEVRWGKKEALYLKWLFPNAKFIFLIRNPYDSYNSYKYFNRCWYISWPHKPVKTPLQFARHWNNLVSEFLDVCQEVSGLIIKYEDIVDSKGVEEISKYLDLKLDNSKMDKVGSSAQGRFNLNWLESFILHFFTNKTYKNIYKSSD